MLKNDVSDLRRAADVDQNPRRPVLALGVHAPAQLQLTSGIGVSARSFALQDTLVTKLLLEHHDDDHDHAIPLLRVCVYTCVCVCVCVSVCVSVSCNWGRGNLHLSKHCTAPIFFFREEGNFSRSLLRLHASFLPQKLYYQRKALTAHTWRERKEVMVGVPT